MSNTKKQLNRHPLLKEFLEEDLNLTTDGAFGWETIGKTSIPYILRGEEQYMSVRMVENKLLSKYPRAYPEEISSRPPLESEFMTTSEAMLLNEINRDHCDHGFGHDLFTTADVVVRVQEFNDFFAIVQKHFGILPLEVKPGEVIRHNQEMRHVTGGWLQVNNTIIPFVYREKGLLKFVPLAVVKYAAELLTDTNINGYELTQEECVFLTNICTDAGLSFNFQRPTKALSINLVCQLSKNVIVKELPKGDPFAHAENWEDENWEDGIIEAQSLLSPTHSPRIPQSVLPHKKPSFCQNKLLNSHHSPKDSFVAHTLHSDVTTDASSKLVDQMSQKLSTQLKSSPKQMLLHHQIHNHHFKQVGISIYLCLPYK